MRLSFSSRLGLSLLTLVLTVLLGMNFYFPGVLRRQAEASGFDQLQAIARLAEFQGPAPDAVNARNTWVQDIALRSGVRVTILDRQGQVLADSQRDAETTADQSNQPEFRQALQGVGRAVRHDQILNCDVLYLAVSPAASGAPRDGNTTSPYVLRFALPLRAVDQTISGVRRRFWTGALLFLIISGSVFFLVSATISRRIKKLQEFSRRIAAGDFRPVELQPNGGELGGLARALNHTAGHLDKTIQVLTDERNRSAAILRSMVEGVAVISAQEKILFSNKAFSQILGLDTVAVEGRPLLEVVRHSNLLAIIKKTLATQEEFSSEVMMGTVQPRSFGVTAAPVKADGPAGAVLVLHDISELRRLERVRQDFVANISHEFRTPLTAIQGFAETLLGGALDDPVNRRRFVEIIRDHAARLARLTEDLLKLSRIEAGQLNLEFRPVSVHSLVESCLDTARLKAVPKELSVAADLPPDLPLVRGDANRLREVLQNLLDNALQYTPPGGSILVSASRRDDQVVITVADTGIGIPQAEQSRIFERFYRVDAARSREAGGTGLGLSIARHIMDAHGGGLWLESAVGEGSRFHFSIPIAS